MKIAITGTTFASIQNPVFRDYAERYSGIYADFLDQVRAAGIELDPHDYAAETAERLARLRQKNVHFRNDGKSLVLNGLSPACVACQTGQGSATFFVSLQCHRSCYYCFNPNQDNYTYHTTHLRDPLPELDALLASGQRPQHLALTGGEPLLHKPEAIAFFRRARQNFPEAHTRLYTCGDFVEAGALRELQAAHLDEIRFSIRMHDLEKGHRHIYDCLTLARDYIPTVMVEMPVMPASQTVMHDVLLELDRLGIASVNLPELCFPWNNAAAFVARGFRVRLPPFRVMYDYWYAGGLPIAGSELACLDLLEFAADQGLQLGVHYCSLENKHTGQVYQQNSQRPVPPPLRFSERDYFLKSAKVFGGDIPRVRRALRTAARDGGRRNREFDYLEFPADAIPALAELELEIGLSTNVMEIRDGQPCVREVQVDLTTPQTFDLAADI